MNDKVGDGIGATWGVTSKSCGVALSLAPIGNNCPIESESEVGQPFKDLSSLRRRRRRRKTQLTANAKMRELTACYVEERRKLSVWLVASTDQLLRLHSTRSKFMPTVRHGWLSTCDDNRVKWHNVISLLNGPVEWMKTPRFPLEPCPSWVAAVCHYYPARDPLISNSRAFCVNFCWLRLHCDVTRHSPTFTGSYRTKCRGTSPQALTGRAKKNRKQK